jgi:hypothetical protein
VRIRKIRAAGRAQIASSARANSRGATSERALERQKGKEDEDRDNAERAVLKPVNEQAISLHMVGEFSFRIRVGSNRAGHGTSLLSTFHICHSLRSAPPSRGFAPGGAENDQKLAAGAQGLTFGKGQKTLFAVE